METEVAGQFDRRTDDGVVIAVGRHVEDEGLVSTLTSCTGSRFSRDSDEYPVPKSSMAKRIPNALSRPSTFSLRPRSVGNDDSVSSSVEPTVGRQRGR